jgi:uncharacterized protein with PQ loop repeat
MPVPVNVLSTAKAVTISFLVVNVLFLCLSIWLLYRGVTDRSGCDSAMPLIIISIIWIISTLIQIGTASWGIYILYKTN